MHRSSKYALLGSLQSRLGRLHLRVNQHVHHVLYPPCCSCRWHSGFGENCQLPTMSAGIVVPLVVSAVVVVVIAAVVEEVVVSSGTNTSRSGVL